jgi:uncharacterized membrane protein YeaQ/YmgE (transglycosylase-associated protein family)
MHWILYILIGLIAGWLAGKITKGHGFGLFGNICIGILGSLLGGFLFRLVGLSAYGVIGSLIMALAGALVLLFLIQLIKR